MRLFDCKSIFISETQDGRIRRSPSRYSESRREFRPNPGPEPSRSVSPWVSPFNSSVRNMSNRLVVVDDTDPNIQYSGPWFTAQNSQLTTGNFGPPFQSTLHGVSNNASFSYSFSGMSRWLVCFIAPSLVFGRFSGSQPTVLGTSITTNASGTQDPTWECFIDNISIGWNFSPGSENENNWVFCQNDQLLDGPHVLSMNVTVLHQQTFWFDQIQYLPSSDVTLYNSTLRVDSSDPAVQYSSGWTELLDIVNLTQSTGSTVTFQFFGPYTHFSE